ncbi:unnamed protein product, partial [Polarella glacialis]
WTMIPHLREWTSRSLKAVSLAELRWLRLQALAETFAGGQGAPDGILRLVWRFLDDTGILVVALPWGACFVDAATCSETRHLPPIHAANVSCVRFSASDLDVAIGTENGFRVAHAWHGRGLAPQLDTHTNNNNDSNNNKNNNDHNNNDNNNSNNDNNNIVPATAGDHIRSVAWSPCGRLIAAAGYRGHLYVIEASSGRVQLEVPHGNVIRMVAWSPDGSQIATVGAEGKLRVVDVGRGIVLQVVQLSSEAALCVDWAPCGTKVATGSDDYVLRVVGVATGSVELEVRTGGWVDFALWSPTGATIAVASDDNKLRFISLLNNSSSNNNNSYSNNNNICGTVAHSGRLRRIAWSPRGDLVATVCDDRCLRVCEGESSPRTITTTAATATATTATAATTATLGRIVSESWQESALVALAWSPSGRKVAIGSEGGSVHIVDARSGLPEAGCDFLAPVTDLAWGA